MMTSTLASVASLTICLAMGNAFLFPVTKVTPPMDSASGKQASSSPGAPLGDARQLGVGGPLSRIDGSEAAEAKKKSLPRVPSAEGYVGWRSRSTGPLHVFTGVEPGIIEDGNATVPIMGGVDGVEGEDAGGEASVPQDPIYVFEGVEAEIIEDDNATFSIVGGVGSGEEEDSGVASVPQDEVVVQYRITVTVEEMSSHETFFEEEKSITMIASAAHESASTTQEEDDDSKQVSEDADLTSDTDMVTDANMATDTDMATDADLESLHQQQLSREASSDVINTESSDTVSEETAFDEGLAVDLITDRVIDELSPVLKDAVDNVMGSKPRVIDDTTFLEELLSKLSDDDDDAMDDMSLSPFDPDMAEDAVDEVKGFMPQDIHYATFNEELVFNLTAADDDVLDDMSLSPVDPKTAEDALDDDFMEFMPHGITYATLNEELVFILIDEDVVEGMNLSPSDPEMAEGAVDDTMEIMPYDITYATFNEELVFNLIADDDVIDDMDTLVPFDFAMVEDAVVDDTPPVSNDYSSYWAASESEFFDEPVNNLVWSVLCDALTRGTASPKDLILDDDMNAAMWSKLRGTISERAAPKPVRLADSLDDMVTCLLHDAFFGPDASKAVSSLAKSANDDEVGGAYVRAVVGLYDKFEEVRDGTATMTDDTTVDQEQPFNLAADGLVDEMSRWPYNPELMAEGTVPDETTPVLYDDIFSNGAAPKPERFDEPANDLVMSVVRDALAKGGACNGLILDAAMDELMWFKMHRVISGREASEPANLADAFDAIITCLMHDALFGPEAFKTVSSFAKSADDSELLVDDYVRAVTKLYDKFKESQDHHNMRVDTNGDHRAKGRGPDSEAPVVRKTGKGRWNWRHKLWRRIRRLGR